MNNCDFSLGKNAFLNTHYLNCSLVFGTQAHSRNVTSLLCHCDASCNIAFQYILGLLEAFFKLQELIILLKF